MSRFFWRYNWFSEDLVQMYFPAGLQRQTRIYTVVWLPWPQVPKPSGNFQHIPNTEHSESLTALHTSEGQTQLQCDESVRVHHKEKSLNFCDVACLFCSSDVPSGQVNHSHSYFSVLTCAQNCWKIGHSLLPVKSAAEWVLWELLRVGRQGRSSVFLFWLYKKPFLSWVFKRGACACVQRHFRWCVLQTAPVASKSLTACCNVSLPTWHAHTHGHTQAKDALTCDSRHWLRTRLQSSFRCAHAHSWCIAKTVANTKVAASHNYWSAVGCTDLSLSNKQWRFLSSVRTAAFHEAMVSWLLRVHWSPTSTNIRESVQPVVYIFPGFCNFVQDRYWSWRSCTPAPLGTVGFRSKSPVCRHIVTDTTTWWCQREESFSWLAAWKYKAEGIAGAWQTFLFQVTSLLAILLT